MDEPAPSQRSPCNAGGDDTRKPELLLSSGWRNDAVDGRVGLPLGLSPFDRERAELMPLALLPCSRSQPTLVVRDSKRPRGPGDDEDEIAEDEWALLGPWVNRDRMTVPSELLRENPLPPGAGFPSSASASSPRCGLAAVVLEESCADDDAL